MRKEGLVNRNDAEASAANCFLRELETQPKFITSTHELMNAFYIPALSRSISYKRGVGFFTSNWIKMAAAGLAQLANNGGNAKIIASPIMSSSDVAALAEGSEAQRDEALRTSLQKSLDELADALEKDTLMAIAWMVADGLLEFKIACPSNDLDGDFHDKFGVFEDAAGDSIAFHGSPNDSAQAFRNYESISAFYSWIDEREAGRVRDEDTRFDLLWRNSDPNVRVYEMPDAIRRNLIEFREHSIRPYKQPTSLKQDRRWRHQKEALAVFLEKRHGVLEMATGTGKTKTAISILNELFIRESAQTAIVAAYGTDLLDQWYTVLVTEEHPVYRSYGSHHEVQRYLNDPEGSILLTSRDNLATALPRLSKRMTDNGLLICDEVHGMGAPSMVANLSGRLKSFGWTLGLSATPDREYDAAGNAFIEAEIGPVIFKFELEDAIRRGILCEFDYVELEYAFSDVDREAVRAAVRRYYARASKPDAPPIESLYQEISKVGKMSLEKLPAFEGLIANRAQLLERCLIFVEEAKYGYEVQKLVMPTGIEFHTYYAGDDRANLGRFAHGELDCLITCHRISEGIDIRSVGAIVLFASARARLETVQRLGRCLRVDPENPAKRALVVDFIRIDDIDPDDLSGDATADVERRAWFRSLAQTVCEER